jgi:hypothetical protein
MVEVPVLATVIWLSAVEAPVDRRVAALTALEIEADTLEVFESVLETPTVAVDSEPEN